MKTFAITGAVLCLAAATPAFAQDETARRQAVELAARIPFEKALKGAPYSAETLVESNQVLADGNRITRKTTGRVYRDTDGRTRREEDRPNTEPSISIVDPVAGYSYSLDPENRIAWRTPTGTAAGIMEKMQVVEEKRKLEGEQLAATKAAAAAAAAGEGRARGSASTSAPPPAEAGTVMVRSREGTPFAFTPAFGPLEHRTIEGVAVEGRKTTTTIPAGKIGNEQPLTIVSEEWRSSELNLLVLTRHSDPRTGESTYRLSNIVRAEPDRSLFMVPADYTVKDTNIRRMLEAQRK